MDISGIPKNVLLAHLFNDAQIMGATTPPRVPRAVMTPAYAQMILDNLVERRMPLYIDQIMGRGLFVQIDDDALDCTMYNQHNGDGAAERVIERIRIDRVD
jgi:hypothetical protein